METCLHNDELREFRSGAIEDEASVDRIADHLAVCAQCQDKYADLPDPPIVQFVCRHGLGAPSTLDWQQPDEAVTQADWGEMPPPAPLAGHEKWECLKLLGRGGMGAVYLARHRHFPTQLRAIKVIQAQWQESGQVAKRFLQEVQVTLDAVSAHENIIRGYDADLLHPFVIMVMEYVRGQSLEAVAAARIEGRLEYSAACSCVLQALAGLSHAAKAGVVHRDLKPGNLMLTPQGTVKILDFGLAKVRAAGEDLRLTGTAAEFCGTPAYCAPEQARDFSRADVRSDLYSLGCTLYRLVAGHPPFGEHSGHTTALALFDAHQRVTPRPLAELRPDVPTALSAAVDRLLAKDPSARHQTPEAAAAALLPFVDEPSRKRAFAWLPDEAHPAAPAAVAPPPRATPQPTQGGVSTTAFDGLWTRCRWPVVAAAVVLVCVVVWMAMGKPWAGNRQGPSAGNGAQPAATPGGQGTRTVSRRPAVVQSGGGSWRMEGDSLIVETTGREGILFGDRAWTDYSFSFEVMKVSGENGIAALFRSPGDGQYYACVLGCSENSQRQLEYVDGDMHRTPDENARYPAEPLLPAVVHEECLKMEIWHTVRVEVTGERAQCYLDGLRVFEFAGLRFSSGRVGIFSHGDVARFRNIRVLSPTKELLWEGPPDVGTSTAAGQTSQALPPAAAASGQRGSVHGPAATSPSRPAPEVLVFDEDSKPLLFGEPSWSDYDLAFEFRQTGKGEITALVRASDSRNGVQATFGALGNSYLLCGPVVDGEWTEITRAQNKVTEGRWHMVLLRVRGVSLECMLDGKRTAALTQAKWPHGAVVLGASGSAEFRGISVLSADGRTLWSGIPER